MNSLAFIKRNNAFTNSKIIAECACIRHDKIKRVIEKHTDRLKKFGKLSSVLEKQKIGRPKEYYLLNKKQTLFLVGCLKNELQVLNFYQFVIDNIFDNSILDTKKFINDKLKKREYKLIYL